MISISQQYHDLVYSITKARQFTPEFIIKMVPTNLGAFTASVSSEASWSKLEEAFDRVIDSSGVRYGTFEGGLNCLDGQTEYLKSTSPSEQIGWVSGNMSDDNCEYEDEWLLVTYPETINTPGHTFFFDESYPAYPRDIDMYYFLDDELLYTEEIRNITDYVYSTQYGVTGYNKILIRFLTSNIPNARIRLIEEVPGLYLIYKEHNIVAVTLSESVDIFSETITSSLVSLEIDNKNNPLDILNDSGREKYLQRRQAVDFYMRMVYPDGSSERLFIGTFYLYNWKSNKNIPTARFNIRDSIDKLYTLEYVSGMCYSTPESFYDIAESVLIAAGVTDYDIDAALINMYTFGILPVASYKECLRLIAQATCSIVKRTRTGGIQIKYIGIPSEWPTEVDELDYSILINPPEVTVDEPIKSVSVAIHTYVADAGTSQVYSGTRNIDGQVTFTVKYSRPANNASASVIGGTLVSAAYFTQAAVLTISTVSASDVSITITGNAITDSSTPYLIDNTIDPSLLDDAEEVAIDNPLVTTNGIAQALAEYTAYWKNRNKLYDFDWRGSPHIELIDPVKVHDDFDNNNVTIITDIDLTYQGGTLSETSKSRY